MVWHHDAVSDLHFLHTAIYRVRAALKQAGSESPIVAVRGVGYTIPGRPSGGNSFRPREAVESALQVAMVPTMIVDTTRRIRFANEAFANLVGYSVNDLEALPSSAVLSPGEDQGVRTEAFARVFRGESSRTEMKSLERRDGSLVIVPMLSARPVRVDGEVVGAILEAGTRDLYHDGHGPPDAQHASPDALVERYATPTAPDSSDGAHIQRDIERWGGMRERADRHELHACGSDGADGLEIDSAAGLEEHAGGSALDDGAHGVRVHVV